MPASDDLYPPAQYGWGWILLAVAVLVVIALGAWLVIALTKPKRSLTIAGAPASAPLFVDVLGALRTDYLGRIQQIEDAYRSRNMDPHTANLELSRTVRAFVNEYSGLEAPVMSLDDLEHRGVHPALIDALRRHYYPSIFQRGRPVDPVAGAEAARKVVTSWH